MNQAGKAERVRVWDLPVRLFHWLVVLLLILLSISGKFGGLDIDLMLPGSYSLYLTNMDVHMLLGQAVLVLVLFRVLWGVFGSGTARFSSFIRGPRAVFKYLQGMIRGPLPITTGHNPAGGLMVLLMLALLLAQSATGLFANDDIFSQGPLAHLVSGSTSAWLTGLHRSIFNFLLAAVILHVAVIAYYLLRGSNLVTAMVTGKKARHQIAAGESANLQPAPWWLSLLLLALAVGLVWSLRWL